jgi:ElaB/YqjD/DUF883 family membrane-anchored ribosome-binding protein
MADDYTDRGQESGSGSGTATRRVREQVTDAASRAEEAVADAGRRAADQVDQKREPTANALNRAASTLHDRAEDLPGGDRVASVAHTAADKIEATAEYVREHDVRAMIDDVQDLARRYPAQVIVAAIALGFLVGRLFRED